MVTEGKKGKNINSKVTVGHLEQENKQERRDRDRDRENSNLHVR